MPPKVSGASWGAGACRSLARGPRRASRAGPPAAARSSGCPAAGRAPAAHSLASRRHVGGLAALAGAAGGGACVDGWPAAAARSAAMCTPSGRRRLGGVASRARRPKQLAGPGICFVNLALTSVLSLLCPQFDPNDIIEVRIQHVAASPAARAATQCCAAGMLAGSSS